MYKHEKWSLLATQCLVKLAQCQKQLKHTDKYLLHHRAERFFFQETSLTDFSMIVASRDNGKYIHVGITPYFLEQEF